MPKGGSRLLLFICSCEDQLRKPTGNVRSRLMRIKDRIDQSGQSSIIYRAQFKDCSNNYTGQTSRKLTTGLRIKEHRPAIRNCNVKTSLMAPHCVDTGRIFDFDETKILSHANSWTTRLLKEAWLSNKNSINKCIELPQAYSVFASGNRLTVNGDCWRRS